MKMEQTECPNFICRRFGTLCLFRLHRQVGVLYTYLPMKMEQTECSETSAYKIQMPRNYPEENIQRTVHGESFKSRMVKFYSQVKESYINFLNHCYIDTEVEMKEIYTSNHMWSLFEKSFLVDMGHVANATHDRKHADTALENYIINSVMNIISTFFNSPFSDQSTTVQVGLLPSAVN